MNRELNELVRNHKEIAREEKEKTGRPVFGTLCSYVPVEILHAFDILPVRLWGDGKNHERADALLPTYICPPARNIMAMGLAGHYDFLDGVIHSYTCDATCGLFNIWCRNLKPAFSFLLSPPYMNTEEAVAYGITEFKALIAALEDYTGKRFSAKRLHASIHLYDTARERIGAIYRANQKGATVRYPDLHQMNLALQQLPIETILPFFDEYLSNLPLNPGKRANHRIMISGSVVSDCDILARIEELGGDIVADDTCLGYRLVQDKVLPREDPLSELVRYYLDRPPCSSRADFPARKEYIRKTISAFNVNAVIFMHQKFCEPHLADHPFLKNVLAEEGIPQLQLELDGEGLTGQIQTRLEGFFEMLEAG
ncbi:MAG: 2-hydroxyacyl-CoA dehydratase family protein [Syntrophaceae bacterium]|nr:2-hydroxyacyl-CoA dehydratase family protein [Pseudomonadota bacterium]MCG2740092.1 2-hydroxyacyl-CoA dehydratase family protein [Syntrophaceae bacterium]